MGIRFEDLKYEPRNRKKQLRNIPRNKGIRPNNYHNQPIIQVAQILDFPCCDKRSWAYIKIDMDRVNRFTVTCKQCRTVWTLEIRPNYPKTRGLPSSGQHVNHPVRWYRDSRYGEPPCSMIPSKVISAWEP